MSTPAGEPMIRILFEDDDLLVVDKPADLVCHPTKAGPMSSLIGRVRLHLGETADGARFVHRLDRETSGVVVLARGAVVARELGQVFATRQVEKRYLAIVHGTLAERRTIDAPLGTDDDSPVAIKDRVRPDGAAAVTDVRPLRVLDRDDGPVTLVEVAARTGRKHQIRIHLAFIGHPVVGDKLYGADERIYLRLVEGALTEADRQALRLPTHALHAASLAFRWRGRAWTFETPPPAAFAAFAGLVSAGAAASEG